MNEELEHRVIGSDIAKIAELLTRYGLCTDTTSLENASQNCIYSSTSGQWNYILNKVVFKIDKVDGRIPTESEDFSASLSVDIIGTNLTDEIKDPLTKLCFEIEIEGIHSENLNNLYASWHLDRHIVTKGDGKPKYSHPMYHFAFGGNKMEAKGDVFGACLSLPSPSLAYPPLDAVLGIDFILQNYMHKDRIAEVIIDNDYIDIVRRAQQRLWKPYFYSILSHWESKLYTTHSDFTCKVLFPLLM